jgi:NAD(P)-dependent dehydrogenase (short-subunit alcohol dehydrogenase family)
VYDLKGKVAIVTGAGRKLGIGRGIALRLAREGADVAVADICGEFEEFPDYGLGMWEGLKETADEISALGVRGLPVRVDVTDAAQVEEMVRQTVEALGRLDILVNNAGGAPGAAPVIAMEEAAWNKTMAINATGAFLCSKAAARQMLAQRQGGKIINIASIAGKQGAPFRGAYTAAKAAVIGLTRVMAMELGSANVQVNAVCPGEVDTDLKRSAWKLESGLRGVPYDEVVKASTLSSAAGRLITPEDVANAVAFLASRQSDYITGQAINVDGGVVFH